MWPVSRLAPLGWSSALLRKGRFQSPVVRNTPPGLFFALSDSENQRWAGPSGLLAGLEFPVREEVG